MDGRKTVDSGRHDAPKNCSACGFPLLPDADRCPRCRVSRKEGRTFWREFWISMLIGVLLMVVSALIVLGMYLKSGRS